MNDKIDVISNNVNNKRNSLNAIGSHSHDNKRNVEIISKVIGNTKVSSKSDQIEYIKTLKYKSNQNSSQDEEQEF